MAFVRRRGVLFAFENVTQMATARSAGDLSTDHAEGIVVVAVDSA